MTVNVLNLPALQVLGFKETDSDSHVKAQPTIASKLWPHCGRPDETVAHPQKTLFIRKLPSHGKSVAIYLDVPLLRCTLCNKTFTAVVPEGDTDRQMTECLAKRVDRYMQDETANWLKRIVPEDYDKYVMLAWWNIMNCIAFVPMAASKATHRTPYSATYLMIAGKNGNN